MAAAAVCVRTTCNPCSSSTFHFEKWQWKTFAMCKWICECGEKYSFIWWGSFLLLSGSFFFSSSVYIWEEGHHVWEINFDHCGFCAIDIFSLAAIQSRHWIHLIGFLLFLIMSDTEVLKLRFKKIFYDFNILIAIIGL